MKKTLFIYSALLIQLLYITSCGYLTSDEERITEVTDSFATKYFTWHFPDAIPYADEDGQRWLQFMSSNVHDADLELINSTSSTPSYSISDISINGDSAYVTLELSNVILMDTLGKSAHLHESAIRILTLKKYEKKWEVHSIK